MKVAYSVVASGDMAGALHYRVAADKDFDPESAISQINSHETTQPILILLHDNGAPDFALEVFTRNLKETITCTIAFITWNMYPRRIWYLVDRLILNADLDEYNGIPAHEVHLRWNASTRTYPVVAPLGAATTHLYAYCATDEHEAMVAWICAAPYSIGVIRRPL